MNDINDILRDPSAAFDNPGEVLAHDSHARGDKVRILEQWRYDLVRLQVASDENLVGDGTGASQIRRVDECLRQLQAGDAAV